MVLTIFSDYLSSGDDLSHVQLLESSGYLENYLWPNYSDTGGVEHTLSILYIANEKIGNDLNVLDFLSSDTQKFSALFDKVVSLSLEQSASDNLPQAIVVIRFLQSVYRTLENAAIRRCALQYLSLPMWYSLSADRLQLELQSHPSLRQHWEEYVSSRGKEAPANDGAKDEGADDVKGSAKKKGRAASTPSKSKRKPASAAPAPRLQEEWMPRLVAEFLGKIEKCRDAKLSAESAAYLERLAEWVAELLSQLPTRRFLHAVLCDSHFVVRCNRALSAAADRDQAASIGLLISSVDSLVHFEVDNQSGEALSAIEVQAAHAERLHRAQQVAYECFREALTDLVFSSTAEIGKPTVLRKHLANLAPEDLFEFARRCGVLSSRDLGSSDVGAPSISVDFVLDVLIDHLGARKGQLDAVNETPLYPTEADLWNAILVPPGDVASKGVAASAHPKLNLQFLSMHDYLLRNYTLFKLESAYEIRQDICDAVRRVAPRQIHNGPVSFGGWARFAVPLTSFSLNEVSKPNIGEVIPSEVRCTVEVDVSRYQGSVRAEWESLREHDVLFLVSIRDPQLSASAGADLFRDERADMAAGRVPRRRTEGRAVDAAEDMGFPKEFGECAFVSSVSSLWSRLLLCCRCAVC